MVRTKISWQCMLFRTCAHPRLIYLSTCMALVAGVASSQAHTGQPLAPHDLWWAWNWDPGVIFPLALSAWLYGRGIHYLWGNAGAGRGVRYWQVVAFMGGWITLCVALVSPLDRLGEVLFSAHMVQHALLMLVAAPLLALSQPLVAFLWGLPGAWRRRLSRGWKQRTRVHMAWRGLTKPGIAWALQTIALWGWHMPSLYQATLVSDTVHALQHLSFLGSALLFWWVLVHGKHGRVGYGLAVLAIFTTAVHSSILGALLTFAQAPWYPAYTTTTTVWGLMPLQDQQLAGVMMWVPAGIIYTLAALAFLAVWLQEAEPSTLRRETGKE